MNKFWLVNQSYQHNWGNASLKFDISSNTENIYWFEDKTWFNVICNIKIDGFNKFIKKLWVSQHFRFDWFVSVGNGLFDVQITLIEPQWDQNNLNGAINLIQDEIVSGQNIFFDLT